MTTSRQFDELFHGATRNYKTGDVVPARPAAHGFGAYATSHASDAAAYAEPWDQSWRDYKKSGQLPLFGTVYKVQPLSGDKSVTYRSVKPGLTHATSEKGFEVTGVSHHVIPWEQEQLVANQQMSAARKASFEQGSRSSNSGV